MLKPNWADVLEAFHEERIVREAMPGEIVVPRKLSEYVELDEETLRQEIRFLTDIGLLGWEKKYLGVKGHSNSSTFLCLTEKGFAVIHERGMKEQQFQLEKDQHTTNKRLSNATYLLFATALTQAIAAAVSVDPAYRELVFGAALTMLTVTGLLMGAEKISEVKQDQNRTLG